jgi:hypothetical protein
MGDNNEGWDVLGALCLACLLPVIGLGCLFAVVRLVKYFWSL